MIQNTEAKIYHFIPIPDKDPDNVNWKQTCEIPTIHTELEIGTNTITYLRFPIPETLSPLDIRAGGEDLEIAGKRIRAQMIHRLGLVCNALQKPNPPLNAVLEFQQISRYFSPVNVQHGR